MAANHLSRIGRSFIDALRAFVRLARFNNAALPALAVIVGAFAGGQLSENKIIVAMVAVILIHSITTIWNDITDEAVDKLNNIDRVATLRRSGVLPHLQILLYASLVVAILLAFMLPWPSRLLTCCMIIVGWTYNAKPLLASRRPITSIAVLGLSYAFLPFVLGATLGHITVVSLLLAAAWTVSRVSLSMLKDYKDAPGDAKAGKKTFLLVYGGRRTARLSVLLAFVGLAAITVMTGQHIGRHAIAGIIALVSIALWLLYERTRLFRTHDYAGLNRVFHDCVLYQLAFDGVVAACWHIS